MSLLENIEKIFNDNEINYFKGNKGNQNIINVPYRGIINPNSRVDIYLDVDEFLKLVKFTVVEKYNRRKDISEIKSQLLDINANLQSGFLSMRSDSDTIEYRTDYTVVEEGFSFKQYNMIIVNCVKIYEMLKERELI